MLSILRQRNYALLWLAAFISGIGNFIFIAALPFFVYSISGSTLATGIALICEMVPATIFSSIGGVYADRWNRKSALVASDWLRGLILLPLFAVHTTSELWVVYLTAFLGATVASFAGPFGNAAIPHVVDEQHLPSANSAFSVGGFLAVLVGSPLGGILLQHDGLRGVVIADVASFLVSGFLVAAVNVRLELRAAGPDSFSNDGTAVSHAWHDWLAGLRFVVTQRWVTIFFVVMMLTFLANGMALVILAPFVKHVLGGSPQLFSLALTAQGLGGIAASLIIRRASARIALASLLSWNILCFGLLNAIIALAASIPVTLTAVLLGGINVLFVVVSMNTILQTRIPDEYRGRVFGAHLTASAFLGLLGSLLAGVLGDLIGIQSVFFLSGTLFIAAGIVSVYFLVPAMTNSIAETDPRYR